MTELGSHEIQVNEGPDGKEIVFPVGDKWYRMPWDNVPEKFRKMYWALVRLSGGEIPKDLDYDSVVVNDAVIELDMEYAEEMDED